MVAAHEIEHHVVEFGNEGFLVYHEKVNFVVGSDLDSNVSFDKIDEASDFESVEMCPFFLEGFFILYDFKEKYSGARPCN